MKKFISLSCALFTFAFFLFLAGCNAGKPVVIDGDYVVITAEIENIDGGGTLKDYMDYLVAEDALTYEMKDGMITSIDGKRGGANRYWMLYTGDTENANEEYTCTYREKTYYQANIGAETLVVKDGCVYIWFLQTF